MTTTPPDAPPAPGAAAGPDPTRAGPAPSGGGPAAEVFDPVRRYGAVRPDEGRWIAGVAAALARRWGVDLVLVRGVLVALALVGGLGIWLYALAWLFLPQTDGRIHAQAVLAGSVSWGFVGAAVLVLLGLPGARVTVDEGFGALSVLALLALVVLAVVVWSRRRRQRSSAPGDGAWAPGAVPPSEAPAPAPAAGWGPPPGTAAAVPPAATGGSTAASSTAPTAATAGSTTPSSTAASSGSASSGSASSGSASSVPASPSVPGATGTVPVTPPRSAPPPPPGWVPPPAQPPSSGWVSPPPPPPPVPGWSPTPPPPPSPSRPSGRWTRSVLGVALLAAGAVAAGDLLGLDVPYVGLVAAGAALAVVGAGVVVAGARGRRGGGLTLVGVLLAVGVTLGSAVSGVVPQVSAGERLWVPGSATAGTEYRLGAGEAVLDLRDPALLVGATPEDPARVSASLGLGRLEVLLPQDVPARVDADLGAGEVREPDGRLSGSDEAPASITAGEGEPVLVVDARLGLGQLDVRPPGSEPLAQPSDG